MALPGAIFSCLLLSLLMAATARPSSGSEERARMAGSFVECSDPAPSILTNATNATEFLSSLLPLLAELPSAAAPTGFASLSSANRAFVRGLCFGDATVPSSDCLGCLAVAARNLTAGCGATTRRAGIWTQGCFVSYGDTHASSPAEDAFRSLVIFRGSSDAVPGAHAPTHYSPHLHAWLLAYLAQPTALSAIGNISEPRMAATADATTPVGGTTRSTVQVLAHCTMDRTMAECVRCLVDSARPLDWDLDADRRNGGVSAAVVGFNCYLRFNVSTTPVPQQTGGVDLDFIGTIIWVLLVLLVLALVLVVLAALCLVLPNGKKKTMKRRCIPMHHRSGRLHLPQVSK